MGEQQASAPPMLAQEEEAITYGRYYYLPPTGSNWIHDSTAVACEDGRTCSSFNGIHARTVVPRPGELTISILPPNSNARCSMLA